MHILESLPSKLGAALKNKKTYLPPESPPNVGPLAASRPHLSVLARPKIPRVARQPPKKQNHKNQAQTPQKPSQNHPAPPKTRGNGSEFLVHVVGSFVTLSHGRKIVPRRLQDPVWFLLISYGHRITRIQGTSRMRTPAAASKGRERREEEDDGDVARGLGEVSGTLFEQAALAL